MKIHEQVLAEARGFLSSRVILTAAELDLFTRLEAGPETAEQLAAALHLDLRALTRLLDVLVTLGFLDKFPNGYSITVKGACLGSSHPDSVRPMLLHQARLWRSWSGLTDIVKQGRIPGEQRMAVWTTSERAAFIGAMHVVGRDLSREIAAAYDASRCRTLLDIGGASATYTIAFLERYPNLRAVLFDLETVIPMARDRLTAAGLLDRVELAAGDFYRDPLPSGCDLALLSAIIHQNSRAQNVALYKKIHQALVPGGKILIRDHIMEPDRTKPPAGALFALNMLVNTEAGDTYTFAEVSEDLGAAGFDHPTLARAGAHMDCLVEAIKRDGQPRA